MIVIGTLPVVPETKIESESESGIENAIRTASESDASATGDTTRMRLKKNDASASADMATTKRRMKSERREDDDDVNENENESVRGVEIMMIVGNLEIMVKGNVTGLESLTDHTDPEGPTRKQRPGVKCLEKRGKLNELGEIGKCTRSDADTRVLETVDSPV